MIPIILLIAVLSVIIIFATASGSKQDATKTATATEGYVTIAGSDHGYESGYTSERFPSYRWWDPYPYPYRFKYGFYPTWLNYGYYPHTNYMAPYQTRFGGFYPYQNRYNYYT